MKGFLGFALDTARIMIIALLIVLPIRAFVFQPFLVRGASMEPNFHNGDYLIIDEFSYHFRNPERGEVIVFRYPNDPSQRYIKRVIGLPGETVEVSNGKITISDGESKVLREEYLPQGSKTPGQERATLKGEEYFVMGDNREFSSDSRTWGSLPEEYIIGKVMVRVFPFNSFTAVAAPTY